MSAVRLAWLIPAFPLAGVVILFLGRRYLKEPLSGWIATLMMVAAFVAALVVFSSLHSLDETQRQVALRGVEWIKAGDFAVRFGLLVDPLSVTMVLFVTGVGALIHLYSIGYMHGQERFTRFFTYLNLFAFSMLVRSHPFIEHGPAAGDVVAWVGALTALVAATIALVNFDIKRVLAYSTISQLGYMFLAVGVGAYTAAIFHMVTHAFFKALLFLGAGSVMHGMEDQQDMRVMGGLRKFMPVTALTFIVAWLAIAGIVPFAGFWSKD